MEPGLRRQASKSTVLKREKRPLVLDDGEDDIWAGGYERTDTRGALRESSRTLYAINRSVLDDTLGSDDLDSSRPSIASLYSTEDHN